MISETKRFFTLRRLDLIVKRWLFLHWLNGSHPDAEETYLWHIDQRAGANKPLQSYLPAARKLFESMKSHGFDERHPVPVNRNGELLGGAHRTACASVLGHKIHIEQFDTDHTWPAWGEEWFRSHGMTLELPRILADLDSLAGDSHG